MFTPKTKEKVALCSEICKHYIGNEYSIFSGANNNQPLTTTVANFQPSTIGEPFVGAKLDNASFPSIVSTNSNQ